MLAMPTKKTAKKAKSSKALVESPVRVEATAELTHSTEVAMSIAKEFVERVVLPPAESAGGLVKDVLEAVRGPFQLLRFDNLRAIAIHVKRLWDEQRVRHEKSLPPRVVHLILEQGSFEEDEEVRKMWAQLIVNAQAGMSIGAFLFELLGKLDSADAKLLQAANGYYGHYPSYTKGTARLEALGLLKEDFEIELSVSSEAADHQPDTASMESNGYSLTEIGLMLRNAATKSIAQVVKEHEEHERELRKL